MSDGLFLLLLHILWNQQTIYQAKIHKFLHNFYPKSVSKINMHSCLAKSWGGGLYLNLSNISKSMAKSWNFGEVGYIDRGAQ